MATRQAQGQDVFQILKQDHRTVTSIMEEIRDAEQAQKEALCSRLENELNQHMNLEEKYVYPILLDFEELSELIQDAYTDHDDLKDILEQMADQDVGSEEWESNFLALEDAKEDHVDTEENEVFPQAIELLSQDQVRQITDQIMSEKQRAPQTAQGKISQPRQPRAER
ncbi:hemerythrin domain-containing protein [Geobacter sp. DSM 9736]|uniref:hemerythrin domain-containing protein n=1 Tax=Geobacter sp. DSM 9736 TaxID=1277350 RepID=UPI000B5120CA|nr:hemerythrin domain-containing protein [Geobacter sp. DSM 9736]SNB45711.1 Hemerythrin HHE cation binding domain-containing protein [Geobacter sp. DSM 9736]